MAEGHLLSLMGPAHQLIAIGFHLNIIRIMVLLAIRTGRAYRGRYRNYFKGEGGGGVPELKRTESSPKIHMLYKFIEEDPGTSL